jgi:hypothetical protein
VRPVERYLSERRWFRRDEVHAKIAQGLESLRQGKGLDGESVMAELIAELDGPLGRQFLPRRLSRRHDRWVVGVGPGITEASTTRRPSSPCTCSNSSSREADK